MSTSTIKAGKTVTGKTIDKNNEQYVYGKAIKTHINKGWQYVINTGVALESEINCGCSPQNHKQINGGQSLSDGGTAKKTIANSNGVQTVNSGGAAYSTTVNDGAFQHVFSGGAAYGTVIKSGGAQEIQTVAALASGTVIKGGKQVVRTGGSAVNTTVSAGGLQKIKDGGKAIRVTLGRGASLEAEAGAVVSAVTAKAGASLSLAAGNVLYGKNTFTGATVTGGTTAKRVSLSKGAALTIGANTAMKTLHLNASKANASITVTGTGSTLGSLKTGASTKISYDVSKLSATGDSPMLQIETAASQTGQHAVAVAKAQGIGVYELSRNMKQVAGTAYAVKLGSTTLGSIALDRKALSVNGVTYSVKFSDSLIRFEVAMKAGKMLKGTDGKDALAGNAHSDIFYGGKGNDIITGSNGRDVAVYDKTAWGKDKIVKTAGTMTILFKDLKKADVAQKLNGTTMTFTRKDANGQSITVQGWSKDTHNVVFGGTMKAFEKWLKASTSTKMQKAMPAARNEVWKKAGLAQA